MAAERKSRNGGGLLERLEAGPVICAEGYLFELERRGYLQAGPYVPEVVLDHPEVVRQLHREFVRAGSDVVEAFTYYGHREKLKVIGKEDILERLNRQALQIAKEVADESGALLAGDLSNTNAYEPDDSGSVRDVRKAYPGLLMYAGNWDDIEQTVILGQLDVIGLNAFFPLADKDGASLEQLTEGGAKVRDRLAKLAAFWQKPIFFNEFGYTTRTDPALRPWEWPDGMTNVTVDEVAQDRAYFGLLAPLMDEPWLAGAFVWRLYADPNDVSQEAEWGFSPRGKLAELTLRDAYRARWAADGPWPLGGALVRLAAETPGVF